MVRFIHHPAYRAETTPGHRFPMGKFARLPEVLLSEGVAKDGFLTPEPVARADLVRAHDAGYVDAVLSQTAGKDVVRRIGLPLNRTVVARSLHACGGTLMTLRAALEDGAACNTAGGSHHAGRAGGAGFCVFNDVGVAVRALRSEAYDGRIAVIDLDVHQGDGTADILRDDPKVFTLSLHAEKNFPARKIFGDHDVGLEDGLGDDDYARAMDAALERLEAFRPDLLIYNAGVDVHAADRLGRLALSDAGLMRRDRAVFSWAKRRGAAVAGVIGGGYDDDIDRLAHRHASLHRACAAIFGR